MTAILIRKQVGSSVESDLRRKLSLEKTFLPDISRAFAFENRVFEMSIRDSTSIPNKSALLETWLSTLAIQYNRVSKVFSKGFDPDVNTLLTLDKELFQTRNIRAAKIVRTSIEDMISATNIGTELLIVENIPVTPRTLSNVGIKLLRQKHKARKENIAVTETQTTSELTKGVLSSGEDLEKTKLWQTVGDSKVRSSHIVANQQRQPIAVPFIVGGFQLRWPGDSSLGAPIGEVAHCRCAAIYS